MISPRAILTAVDFADVSHAALVLAGRLARHYGAALHVLFVEQPLLEAAADWAGIDAAAASRVELRRLIREAWPASECSPQLHVVAGPPARVIFDVAREQCVDLIVVASGHQSDVERRVFGSTTARLLCRADVSVLVAPASWVPADSGAMHQSLAGTEATLDEILGTSVQIVRGAKGSRIAPIVYRALSAGTVPILLQIVESVLE